MVLAYPEYRGTAVLEASSAVTRTIPGFDAKALDAAAQALKYQPSPDGGYVLSSFHIDQPRADQVRITIDYAPEQISALYTSPNSLTSEELAYYLPKNPASEERFVLTVRYVSSQERSRQLVQQAVERLVASGQWAIDGAVPDFSDGGVVPHDEDVKLKGADQATLRFERAGGQVHVAYEMITLVPSP